MEPTSIGSAVAGVLAERLTGEVTAPDDPRYDDARRPALIARCRSAADVGAVVAGLGTSSMR